MIKYPLTKSFLTSILAPAITLFIIFSFRPVVGQISLVSDICPLYDGSESGLAPAFPISFKGSMFFSANSAQGRELWISDGTAAGTRLLKDINPGAESSNPSGFFITENYIYFFATDGLVYQELWRTDGTAEGTIRIDKFNLRAFYGIEYLNFTDLAQVNNQLFFVVQFTNANGNETRDLWVTDATVDGTKRIKVNVDSGIGQLAVLNGMVYFTAKDATYGREIWRTDGTTTEMIGELSADNSQYSVVGPLGLRTFGDALYFNYTTSNNNTQFWKSDGTLEGSHALSTDAGATEFSSITAFYTANTNLYMIGTVGTQWGMWKLKEGSETINFVKSFTLAPNIKLGSIQSYVAVDTVLYFSTMKSDYTQFRFPYEVWKCDGTEAGTHALKENSWDALSTPAPFHFTNLNGSVYFVAGSNGDSDPEESNVWRTDGTAASTYQITHLHLDPNSWGGTSPTLLCALNESLYFVADHMNSGNELWKTDGTIDAEEMVTDYPSGSVDGYLTEFAELNGNIVFPAAHETKGIELFFSDGTEAGTTLLKDIRPGPSRYYGSSPTGLFSFGNAVYFMANDGTNGNEVWKTDGTEAGTVLWKDIVPGSGSSSPTNFFKYKDNFVFIIQNSGTSNLLISDGNAANTTVLGNASYHDPNFTVFQDKLYFARTDYSSTTGGLFVTDGTVAETKLVKQFYSLNKIINLGEKLILIGQPSGSNKSEVWVSDGTSAGTTKITDNIGVNYLSSAVINGNAYFLADDGVHGRELWKSDGTTAGTSMVLDIFSGSATSNITSMIALNSTLIFSADDGVNGKELWKSDGTAEGTQLLDDVFTGMYHGNPEGFVKSRGYIYFTANDGVNRSLYKTNGRSGCGTIKVTNNTDVNLAVNRTPFLVGHRFFLIGEKHNIGNELFLHDQDLDYAVAQGCRQTQSIAFDEPANILIGGESQALSAVATSQLPVSFVLSNSNATVTDNLLVPASPGTITITAKQPGNNWFEAAEDFQYEICVTPAKPIISPAENSSFQNPQLISSSDAGNQWFWNNEAILGETSQTLSVLDEGNYTVNVTIDGCASATSEQVTIVITGIIAEEKRTAQVYPTIARDFITIEFEEVGNHSIQIISASGRALEECISSERTVVLPVKELPTGIYFIKVMNSSSQQNLRFVKK